MNTLLIYLNNVIISLTWGQSAWIFNCTNITSKFTVKSIKKNLLNNSIYVI